LGACGALHSRPNQLDAKFQVPVFIVMGEKGYALKFSGTETTMRSGVMENFAPDLKITFIPEGSHFVQEQLPEQVNQLFLASSRTIPSQHNVPAPGSIAPARWG
jgi:pimeloyl-ACP methyl ester carboxylesterase